MKFDLPTLVQRIGTVPHFKNLSIKDLTIIVTSGQVKHYKAQETLLFEGEPCAGLFVLFRGEINLSHIGPNGKCNIISVISPIIMFNEVAVLDGGPNMLTATAVMDCITWHVSYERFHALMERYPQIGLSLLKVLATRTRSLVGYVEDISFRSVMGRTAKMLLELSENGTKPISRHEHTNLDLAAKAATVPEAVCRSFRILRQHAVISSSRAWIKVIEPEALAQFAEVEQTPCPDAPVLQ